MKRITDDRAGPASGIVNDIAGKIFGKLFSIVTEDGARFGRCRACTIADRVSIAKAKTRELS